MTGFAGAIIWTAPDRFAEMADFYLRTVGIPARSRRPGFVNFDFDGVRLTIATHSGVAGPASSPTRVMVNLWTKDLDVHHRRLVSAGVTVVRPPEREHWGGLVATYADPDGNAFQLFEQGELKE